MVLATSHDLSEPLRWPEEGVTRVPFRLFSDQEIYELEQERIFRGPVWHYLCLDVDVPNSGDYKTTTIGEVPVVVTRDEDGALHAMVNRCAHKGALVCLKDRGNAKDLTCVYHSWSYDLKGQLQAIAFRKGLNGSGGMPDDFDVAKHRLQPIRLENFCGLVFGTFDTEIPGVEDFLGPDMAGLVRRNYGKPLKRLGMHSQILHNNWKLYAENLRDSYHATILHTFYTAFDVNRLDMDGGIMMSDSKWHHCSYAKRGTVRNAEEYQKVQSAQYNSKLNGPHLLDVVDEKGDGITHTIQAVFPSICLQYTLNSLAVRFFQPRGVDKTELFWIYLGYQDDDAEMTQRRLRQSNLTGAAGLVSLEDGCINEFVQRGTQGSGDTNAFLEMGGRDAEPTDASRATETAIRGFWTGYRRVMGFE
jgi:anthranilate 1,2-dioxygenase large subunit